MSPENFSTDIAASSQLLHELIHRNSADELKALASDPALTEDLALALLKHNDLPPELFELLARNRSITKFRKVKLAIIANPRTPRFVSIAQIRQLFTFDLMQVALRPVVPGDIKRIAEEALINRLETLSSGEKLALARRASGPVAAAPLSEREARVIQAALDNGRLTEAFVVKALTGSDSSAALVRAVCDHAKWSLRREIRTALLRNEKTPPARALEIARTFPAPHLREILHNSRLSAGLKSLLTEELARRSEVAPGKPAAG